MDKVIWSYFIWLKVVNKKQKEKENKTYRKTFTSVKMGKTISWKQWDHNIVALNGKHQIWPSRKS